MKTFSFPQSQKGFNMFSAIVAVVLIMTVSVLIGMLVMSEEKTSTQIYGMLNNYQLADAANIARADALQSFNFSFREKIEDYLTYNPTELESERGMELFLFRTNGDDVTFDQLQAKFEENILLNTNSSSQDFSSVLDYVSENTINNFADWTYGKYRVELNDKSSTSRRSLYTALATVLNRQKEEGLSFLEIVDCTQNNCPKGSFYFNIPLNKLTDEEYALIPRIIVKDTFTQEQIKMAILPKTNLKIYIPLRFFKVLNEAMDAARGIKMARAQNAQFKLGFCDVGYCAPRTNALSAPSSREWTNRDCPLTETGSIVTLDSTQAGINNYFAGGGSTGVKGLAGYGAEEVCKKSSDEGAFLTDTLDNSFLVYNQFLAPSPNNYRTAPISGCGYHTLIIGATPEVKVGIRASGGQKLKCARIISVSADIVFVDTNPNFLVKGTTKLAGVNSNFYKIRITDNSFAPAIKDDFATITHECSTGGNNCRP
jgi:hypothetical protein